MNLSKWKELADRKAKTGEMKRNLFEEITEEKIRSKTTDQAIPKTFRLDRLDQIAEQTKPKPRRRIQIPRINREGGIDYVPEVDPYEDMDVEGLLNLEDYVAPGVPPQAEKQIAKIPSKAPKYEMDPSFWQLDDPPPLYEEKDPLAIEGPPQEEDDDDNEYVDAEEEQEDPNKILDQLDLPNYNDVEMRLNEPEMTATKQRNYLQKVVKDADTRRRQAVAMKSNATKDFKAGKITQEERKRINEMSDKSQKEIKDYMNYYKNRSKTIKGDGLRRGQSGKGAYFFNDAKEMLQKLTLIIAEMEAGNTSIDMRNMGQTILDALFRSKHLNKQQYGQLVKKYFAIQYKMEREITLSGFAVKNQRGNRPGDFTTRFTPTIQLGNDASYYIGFDRIISMFFSWTNVNAGYNNQKIVFSKDDGKTWTDIDFAKGVWTYHDLDKYIKEETKTIDGEGNEDYPITLTFDDPTFRVIITLATNYQLDLTKSDFNELIGYDKKILKDETNIGVRVPNLTQDTDVLHVNIHCDLISNLLVDGEESDIIYSFGTSTLRASYGFVLEPRRVIFNPVNKTSISSIRIYITDGLR